MFITSNIVLKLLPGRHVLTNTFIVQNIEKFTIEGQIETENSPYPVIQYTAENYSMDRPVVHFNNSFNITLRQSNLNIELTITICSWTLTEKEWNMKI